MAKSRSIQHPRLALQARRGELLRIEKIQFNELQSGDAHKADFGAQSFFDQPFQRGAISDLNRLTGRRGDHVLVQLSNDDDLRLPGFFW